MVKDFTRQITHEDYGKAEVGLKKYYHKVDKVIFEAPYSFSEEEIKKGGVINFVSQYFITKPDVSNALPLILGGVSLAMIIIFLMPTEEKWTLMPIIFFSISCVTLIFSIIYFFTKPKKEKILNRRDGLVTMEGALWQPNITMRFKDIIFCYSTGGDNAIGAFKLEAIRPNNFTFSMFNAGASECYQDMSFFTWYMDKNRPLPPGTAFDAYREEDFKRRKTEGFPPPLYVSNVPTPEATPEQQIEREKFWKEEFIKVDGKTIKYITQLENQ